MYAQPILYRYTWAWQNLFVQEHDSGRRLSQPRQSLKPQLWDRANVPLNSRSHDGGRGVKFGPDGSVGLGRRWNHGEGGEILGTAKAWKWGSLPLGLAGADLILFIVWKGSWFWLFTHFGAIKSEADLILFIQKLYIFPSYWTFLESKYLIWNPI